MYYSSVYKIFWGPKGGFERTPRTPPAYGLDGCMYDSIFLNAFILFACKVCLKQWDLDYDSMLQLLNISRLLVCRTFLTMYNIVSGHMYFPSSIFVQSNLPYQFNCTSTFNSTRRLDILPVIHLIQVIYHTESYA